MDSTVDNLFNGEIREASVAEQADKHLDGETFTGTQEKKLGEPSVDTRSTRGYSFKSPSGAYYDILRARVNRSLKRAALRTKNHSLPPELLTTIFEFVMLDGGFPHRSSLSPLVLSHVCSTWRNAALGSSGLWNQLSLDALHYSRPYVLPDVITCWFRRTNNARSLVFSLRNLPFSRVAEDVTHSLVPFLDRLSSLRLEKVHVQSLVMMLCLAGDRLPMLKWLFLECDGQFHDIPRVTVFSEAQHLRCVTLSIPSPILADGLCFVFPWAQLATLHVSRAISLDTLSKILVQCLNLQAANFLITTFPNETPLSIPLPHIVIFPSLSVFMFQLRNFTNLVGLADILCRLHFPIIERIMISSSGSSPFPFPSIHPGRTETLRSVRALKLFEDHTTELELLQFISACPLLEELKLMTRPRPPHVLLLRGLRLGTSGTDTGLPLLYLKSFSFIMLGSIDIQLVVGEFIQLILSWATDTARKCELEVVTLDIYDSGDDAEITQKIRVALDDIRHELGPWIRAEAGTGRNTGLILTARVFHNGQYIY